MPTMTNDKARLPFTPLFRSQNKGVAAMVAINAESKNGTTRSWAVLSPAATTNNAAMMTRVLLTEEGVWLVMMARRN